MEKRGGNRNITLFTSKSEKTLNMKMKYGHKQRVIRRKEKSWKDVTPTSRIQHPKQLEYLIRKHPTTHENIQQHMKTIENT